MQIDSNILVAAALFKNKRRRFSKYANAHDLVIGTPVTHRNRSELNNLIGFFVNTLPIRFKLDPRMTTMDLLGMVRQTMLEGFTNQDAPFEAIVDAVIIDNAGQVAEYKSGKETLF